MIPYNPQGLTPEEVAASRAAHGENIITPQRDDSAWRLLAEKFRDPIIIVLLVAAALSLAMAFMEGNFTETIGILCAILLATCVGFLFEWDAMRRFRRLNRVNDEQPVKVRRGGVMREIPRREVVVGDLVSLEAGETVPADGELVEAVSLQMDESTLTGEPETAKYVDEELFDPEATYPSNRLLRGTTVRDGYGRMVVTAVGDATEAGRVTEQATVQSGEQTPLHRQLTRLSRQIGKVGIALSVLIFVILIGKAFLVEGLADAPWPHVVRIVLNCFMVSVAMIVMAVPEGLPMSITLSLALSMRRMLKTNNLVRKMHACETMGHLHRQDGHAHPEPDARAGDHPLRASRRAAARRVGGGQLDRLPRRRRPSAGQSHRRRAARMAPARKRRLRRTARRGADSRPADLLDRTQIHGYAH